MKSLYRGRRFRLASLWRFAHLEVRSHSQVATIRDGVMLFNPRHEDRLGGLEERLRRADALTPDLMTDVIAEACTRFAVQNPAARAKINRLLECGAWTDATLALVELDLPSWKLRRLVYDDGEWLCSLSNQPGLPLGLDELAEANHEMMPLAILIAFLRARQAATESAATFPAVPQARATEGYAMCCDNFS
jgi:hypothetical protein